MKIIKILTKIIYIISIVKSSILRKQKDNFIKIIFIIKFISKIINIIKKLLCP